MTASAWLTLLTACVTGAEPRPISRSHADSVDEVHCEFCGAALRDEALRIELGRPKVPVAIMIQPGRESDRVHRWPDQSVIEGLSWHWSSVRNGLQPTPLRVTVVGARYGIKAMYAEVLSPGGGDPPEGWHVLSYQTVLLPMWMLDAHGDDGRR